nr:glycosyl hydrolases family 31 protein [Tanacetum cinerariifolium]
MVIPESKWSEPGQNGQIRVGNGQPQVRMVNPGSGMIKPGSGMDKPGSKLSNPGREWPNPGQNGQTRVELVKPESKRSAKAHKISIENNRYLRVPSKVDDIIWVAFNLGPDSDIDHHDSCTGSPTANKWTPAPADPVKYYIELVSSLQGWVVTVMTLMSLRPLAASPFITYKSFEIDAISVDVYFPSENCSSLFNYSIAVSVGYGSHVRFDAPADHINVHFREGNVLALQKEA